jgi:hypothetical protein
VNIIHSSSLASYPVAYNKQQSAPQQSGLTTVNNSTTLSDANEAQPSSTEQIKNALSQAGMTNENDYNQTQHSMSQKAINAYTQNRNQVNRLQISQTISGIDIYA